MRSWFAAMEARVSAVPLLLFLAAVHGAEKLPSYVTKCPSRERAQFKACVLQNTRAALAYLGPHGDKKYGVSPADPINFPLIETDSNGFKLRFVNMVIKTDPPQSYKVDDIDLDLDRQRLAFSYSAPALDMIGKYETDGRILVLPVKGEGDAKLRIDGYKAKYTTEFDVVKNPKDMMEYIKLKNMKFDADVTKVTFNFTNLFNGDETLGKATNDFLNENWKDVFEETKWSTYEATSRLMTQQIQSFFDRVPYSEAFPE